MHPRRRLLGTQLNLKGLRPFRRAFEVEPFGPTPRPAGPTVCLPPLIVVQRFVSLPRQHKKFSDTNAFQRATDRTCTSLLFATFDGGTICGSAIPPNFCAPPICLTCCRKAINS